MDYLIDISLIYWFRILGSLLALITFRLLYNASGRGMMLVGRGGRLDSALTSTLTTVIRWFLFLALCAALLEIWGLVENVWTAVTGVLALIAIGFVAVWSVLSNALCSILLHVTRPIRMGDYIEFAGEEFGGKVHEIKLLHTILIMEDGGYAQIPNNLLYQRVIKRYPNGKPGPRSSFAETEIDKV